MWPDLDATAIMMKVVGYYDTPPKMPDTSHLCHPFGGFYSKLYQNDASAQTYRNTVAVPSFFEVI